MWPVCRMCQTELGADAANESITHPSIDSTKLHTMHKERLMKRGHSSATIGHDNCRMSWKKAAAAVVAKTMNGSCKNLLRSRRCTCLQSHNPVLNSAGPRLLLSSFSPSSRTPPPPTRSRTHIRNSGSVKVYSRPSSPLYLFAVQ